MDTPLRGQSLDLSTPSTIIQMDPNDLPTFYVSSDSDSYHKIKRVLGQRDSKYLVQIVGEPADNAVWVASSALNAKAKRAIKINPPPTL